MTASEIYARKFAAKLHPSAILFRDLPIGAGFSFPLSDRPGTPLKKTASGWYEAPSGRRYRTGALVAVVPFN
jgi:hypothetical protein